MTCIVDYSEVYKNFFLCKCTCKSKASSLVKVGV